MEDMENYGYTLFRTIPYPAWAKESTTPKGVAFSLTSLPRVGCVALANPALSKV